MRISVTRHYYCYYRRYENERYNQCALRFIDYGDYLLVTVLPACAYRT